MIPRRQLNCTFFKKNLNAFLILFTNRSLEVDKNRLKKVLEEPENTHLCRFFSIDYLKQITIFCWFLDKKGVLSIGL
ncbi:hypothetical protein EB008_01885 [bacterium]|nr:hypothetical protein [bacterium]